MADSFQKILQQKRRDKKLTQAELSRRLGISIKQYQNYEYKENSIPPLEKLKKLTEILDFDFTKLVYEYKHDKIEPPSEAMMQLIKNITTLVEANKQLVENNSALLQQVLKNK
jgi:transcriptional regulator with XRE-family HTH domain